MIFYIHSEFQRRAGERPSLFHILNTEAWPVQTDARRDLGRICRLCLGIWLKPAHHGWTKRLRSHVDAVNLKLLEATRLDDSELLVPLSEKLLGFKSVILSRMVWGAVLGIG